MNTQLSHEQLGRELAEAAGLKVFKHGYFYHRNEQDAPNTKIICESLDAVAEVEKIVIEKVGSILYSQYLRQILYENNPRCLGLLSDIAMMPAKDRAEACLLALKGEKE